MKVYFEIKDDWVDYESPTGMVSYSIRQMAQRALYDAFVEQLIKKTKMPKIQISVKELKKAVLDKMAERAIEQHE